MFSLRKPSSEAIHRFLSDQKNRDFTYSAVGGTSGTPPAGFVVDHTRIQLAKGQSTFDAARMAIKRWEHFQLGWVETSSTDIPIERRQVVGVMARAFGVWVLNACRIVTVIDETVMSVAMASFTAPCLAMSNPVKSDFRLNRIKVMIPCGTISLHSQDPTIY